MSLILGIHDGHGATACLTKDGELLALISEERFNREKNWGGVPVVSAKWCLDFAGVSPSQLDAVALTGLVNPPGPVDSSPHFPLGTIAKWSHLAPQRLLATDLAMTSYLALMKPRRKLADVHRLLDGWGVPREKLEVHEHHHCHAASAYHFSGLASETEDTLVLTLDGSGDGICGTASVGRGRELQRRHHISSYHSIGLIYSLVTRYLGMKALEHEYKVMGLAPYAPEKLADKAYKIFSSYIGLSSDGLSIHNTSGAWGTTLYRKMSRDLNGIRFDAVSAGLQNRIEEVVIQWVSNWIKKTGIRRLCFAGGVFMNVKVNMLIQALPEVDQAFFMPSGGDESLALGAVALSSVAHDGAPMKPIHTLYLGTTNTEEEIAGTIRDYGSRIRSERMDEPELRTAQFLAAGRVVGRCSGRMEWGARSLGNRALLADGRDMRVVRKLNAAIKQRDFWMPFAPSILWERRNDYLQNPRDVPAPFMALAFPSTPLAYQHLIAGLHAYDLTCRPQLVKKEDNPAYHRVLSHWEALTGCGGVLNTSFNLHGEPIVMTPRDAIETLLRSEIDDLVMDNYHVTRVD